MKLDGLQQGMQLQLLPAMQPCWEGVRAERCHKRFINKPTRFAKTVHISSFCISSFLISSFHVPLLGQPCHLKLECWLADVVFFLSQPISCSVCLNWVWTPVPSSYKRMFWVITLLESVLLEYHDF